MYLESTFSPGMLLPYRRCTFRWPRAEGLLEPSRDRRQELGAWSLEAFDLLGAPILAITSSFNSSLHQAGQHGSWDTRVILDLIGTDSGAAVSGRRQNGQSKVAFNNFGRVVRWAE